MTTAAGGEERKNEGVVEGRGVWVFVCVWGGVGGGLSSQGLAITDIHYWV